MGTSPIRVLLVEDHAQVLWGLNKLIEGEMPSMKVVGTAISTQQALAVIPVLQPDVIVLDAHLGDASSLESLPRLHEASDAGLVVLDSHDAEDSGRRAVAQSATTVLKDAPAEVLLEAIERAHARRSQRRTP